MCIRLVEKVSMNESIQVGSSKVFYASLQKIKIKGRKEKETDFYQKERVKKMDTTRDIKYIARLR